MSNSPALTLNSLSHRWQNLPPALRESALYAAAIVVTKGAGFALIPVFTAFLTPADYGRLDILQTLADLLSIVLMLGLSDALFRFHGLAAPKDKGAVLRNIFGLACVLSVIFTGVLQLLAPVIQSALPGQIDSLALRALLVSLGLSIALFIPLCHYRLAGRAGDYFTASTGRVVLQAGLALCFLAGGFGVTGVMCATAAASLFWVVTTSWRLYRENGIGFDLQLWASFLRYGSPLIVAGLAGFVLRSLDRLILAESVGVAALAPYALAAKFGLLTALLVYPFELYWQPRRFAALRDNLHYCATMVTRGLFLCALCSLLVSLLAPLVIVVITPHSYHTATLYIAPLCLLTALHFATQQVNLGLLSGTNSRWPALIDCAAAGLVFGGYLVLIPLWGIWGAVLSTASVLVLRLVITFVLAQKMQWLPYRRKSLLWLVIVSLLTTAAQTWSLHTDSPAVSVVFGGIGFVLILAQAWQNGLLKNVKG